MNADMEKVVSLEMALVLLPEARYVFLLSQVFVASLRRTDRLVCWL